MYLKLQLENGYTIDTDFEHLYINYSNYCGRNKMLGLSCREFALSLNTMGIKSINNWDSFTKKTIVNKELTMETITNALEKLGGELIVENIYTVLGGKRYQLSIKLIPLEPETSNDLSEEAREVDAMTIDQSLTNSEPEHSGEEINN